MTPRLKQQILSIVCHYLNIPLDLNLEPLEGHHDRWATYCPVHESDRQGNPSLHVYIGKHKLTGQEEMHFSCKSRNCSSAAITACFERDDLQTRQKNDDRPKNWEVNIPPHAEPDWSTLMFKEWPVTNHWAFFNREGQIAFWHIRADKPQGRSTEKTTKKKIYSRIYSVTDKDTEKKFFAHRAILKEKPIPYNAFYLPQRLEAPILIVEGPKTADAAAKRMPEYLVLTWDEGTANYNKFDWSMLQGRNTPIYLFPDNDEPGIKAMRGLAKILISMDLKPLITLTEQLPEPFKEGWDIADSVPHGCITPEELIEEANEVEFTEEERKSLEGNIELQQSLAKLDKRFVLVHTERGEHLYYDLDNPNPFSKTGCPYLHYNKTGLYNIVPDKYYDQDLDAQCFIIDAWLDQPNKTICASLTYDPSTTDKIININENIKLLNIFMGFATKPIESQPIENQWFVNHLIALQGRDEAEYTLSYIADIIQNPGRKPGTMMLWAGTQGNGKSLIGKIIVRLLGQMNAIVINAKVLADQFTSEFASKIFVMPEEMPDSSRARDSINQELKYLITADHVRLNSKGVAAYQIPSFHRIIVTSNNIISMKLDEDERRTTIIQCKAEHLKKSNNMILDNEYFNPLFAKIADPIAMGKLMHFLGTYEITLDVSKPFITKTKKQLQRPKDPVQAFVEELLDNAILPNDCRMLQSNWPIEEIMLPRSVIKKAVEEYCKKYKLSFPGDTSIHKTLMKLMPPVHKNKLYSRYFDIPNNKGEITTLYERTYELLEINKHREFYETVTESKPDWSEINTAEIAAEMAALEAGDNVVPLKRPKQRDDDII